MTAKRLAAIDIGTNSIRCIVVEADGKGSYRVLDDEKVTVRLGEGLARDKAISAQAWERAMEALVRMRKIVDGYRVCGIEAVATSAVRSAGNGSAFIAAIAETVGIEVAIISGEEEAELAALSAMTHFDMEGIPFVMVDIGGGSLEVVTAVGRHLEQIRSLDLGAVLLTERFVISDPIQKADYLKLRRHIRKELKGCFTGEISPVACIIGSGGTVTSIASMVMAMRREEYGSIHGYELLRSELVHLLAMLVRKDLKGRRSVPGLNPDRADIIVAGVAAIDVLMEFFSANLLRVNERGLREGLIIRGMRKHGLLTVSGQPRTWRESVLEFARSCHVEIEHAQQVGRLSVSIFDATAPIFSLGDRDRQMLEAAALLHDIGYFISYAGHHKHSYHLIRHADLFGFTPRERELIANIARYHRKSIPKKKHEAFARLTVPDRQLVQRLGGILRLADGLDRRRNSLVSDIRCRLTSSAFQVDVNASEDVSVELFGARAKSDLFEKAFGRRLAIKRLEIVKPANVP
jgi:exopolyphosphatase/guanosine-5'-triphosphate,3'-diphosphate pyrophosphatase